jgi:NAD(P)-dependent dehydrogenase (short-subunit alcohol dehydrogenase family)
MASPVEFINMVENAYALGVRVFVEVGPKRAQSGFIGDILKGRPHRALFVCHPKQGELTSLGRAIASLCADGVISYGGLREEPARQVEAPREEPSKRLQPLPEPFFIRQLRLEDAPPRAPLPFSIEESRTCILYSPETEHLLPLFSGVAIDVSVEPNEATIKEKLGGESCEVLLDLCLFGEQAVQDVLGAALFHTKRVLRIAKLFHEQKPKRVLVYTPLGGGFGIPNESFESPSDAALSAVGAAIGSWKSVIREWHGEGLPWYPLSIIDLPAQPSSAIWQEAKQELLSSSSFEVSLLETSLGVLRRAPKYCIGVHPESALLKKSSVVALLGGGRGITATIATQLAKEVGCRLSLFGRTQSRPEVPAFDRARALFAAKEQLGPTASRSQLQKRAEELLRQKELAATLSQLKEQGADFFYQQGDIRFANQVRNFLEETVRRFGTIDAIIYGSGIDRSRGLQNKTEAEVDEVLSTFLQSEIFKFCKEKNCKLVVLGSLSSRYGNFGQLDYGAAHEALAKIARGLPASLVLDFTAWSEIGMAAPLASTFKERGIDLLPPSIGARVAVDAMQSGLSGEWVVSGKVPQPNLGGAFLQGRAELFVPWSALRQSATARESLLVNGKIHPAFLIEAAREAAQSIFLPVKVTSMHATLTESGSSKITILAEQEKQSGQEVCCRVQVTGESGELLTCTTTTRKQMVRPVQTLPDKKSISVKDEMSRYEPAHRLIERAWSDGERSTGAARSVVLVAHDGISRGVLARLFLLQAASLFGHTLVEREHEIIFLRELATPTAIAIIEDGSCVLQDAEGVICEVWSAPATTGRR